MLTHLLSVLLAFGQPSAFAADAPEFLLGDLGVRIDLPASRWRMTRWSDSDFEGKIDTDPILLYAWATSVQAPVTSPEAWAPVFVSKAEEMQGTNPQVTGSSIEDVDGRKFAFVNVEFGLSKAGAIALRGATAEIAGKNIHLAVIAPQRLARVAERERTEIVRRLEFTTPVADPGYGGTVSTDRVTTQLPPEWRALQEGELDVVSRQLVKLGLEDLTGCWTAIHPRPAQVADVMVTCGRPLHVGVVDAHSFEEHETTIREKLFGPSVPAGRMVEMQDRTGFLFVPRDGLAMGAAPDSDQVAVTWALGDRNLGDAVAATLRGSTYKNPHAASVGDQVGYWVKHRTFSAPVLCPSLCCLGTVGLMALGVVSIVALRSRRKPSEDE